MCNYGSVQLYCQDESRFGLHTHIGRCLTARGIKPVVDYKHSFQSTYIFGCFSLSDGAPFFWEIDGVSKEIFHAFLNDFSKEKPNELKIVLIDNAGFHSVKDVSLPDNIVLVNIPPYTPELNPAERVWQWMKQRFKTKCFKNKKDLTLWLYNLMKSSTKEIIKPLINNDKLLIPFYEAL